MKHTHQYQFTLTPISIYTHQQYLGCFSYIIFAYFRYISSKLNTHQTRRAKPGKGVQAFTFQKSFTLAMVSWQASVSTPDKIVCLQLLTTRHINGHKSCLVPPIAFYEFFLPSKYNTVQKLIQFILVSISLYVCEH